MQKRSICMCCLLFVVSYIQVRSSSDRHICIVRGAIPKMSGTEERQLVRSFETVRVVDVVSG